MSLPEKEMLNRVDLSSRRNWCGSSSSIRVPSLKFVGLAIRKICGMMCVVINGPGDPDLWPFYLESGMRVASEVGNLPSKFGHARPSGSRIIHYVRDGRTDGQTDGRTNGQKKPLFSPSLRAGHNKITKATRCRLSQTSSSLVSATFFQWLKS